MGMAVSKLMKRLTVVCC